MGFAKETESLEPKHRYTPWITINGEVYTVECQCSYYIGGFPEGASQSHALPDTVKTL